MAKHLLERTLPEPDMRLAEYYGRSTGVEEALAQDMGAVPTVRADIHPALSEALALRGGALVNEEQLTHILCGMRADGAQLPGEQRVSREDSGARSRREPGEDEKTRLSYFDLCLSAPKSVSVAWAFAETDAERNSILQAHRDARDATLRYIEETVAKAGFGKGHAEGEERGSIAWISVDHFTSRPTLAITRPDPLTGVVDTEIHTVQLAGDPQLHSHNLVPNIMVTESGRVLSVKGDQLRGRIHEFGAVYQALLAQNLRGIGIDVQLDERTRMASLPAIPERVTDEFSKRTRDGEQAARDYARSQGLDWNTLSAERRIGLLKEATQKHKLAKDMPLDQAKAWENSARKDDLANATEWRRQAEAIGWKHRSAIAYGPPAPELSREDRLERAYGDKALPLLSEELQKRAVVMGTDARLAAARALIEWGMKTTADIGELTRAMARRGVMQDGRMTRLIWREAEAGRTKITTELHRSQEAELVGLMKAAAADRAGALDRRATDAAVAASGLRFDGEHGEAQLQAIRSLGEGGRFGVVVGVAGAGKTTLLQPLVAAWKEQGREVWGVADAWKQATALSDAGIARHHARALQPFLDGVAAGKVELGPDSVVVVDELGRVGTRQLLQLARLQAEHGFAIKAMGDDRQCQSIEAGPVIELARRALGREAIPEILTTVRQRSEEEREVTALFRSGDERQVLDGLRRKAAAGTAELVPGGYAEAVQRVATLWRERTQATREQPGYTVTISAPTNADAREISLAIRRIRQEAGEIGPDAQRIRAVDNAGSVHGMALASGDRVRLYARTRGLFTDDQGRRKSAAIGDNGSVLTVVEAGREGLHLRAESGRVGFVAWAQLQDRSTGNIRLGYGDCLTIDSSQGITSDEHISAMPAGSLSVQGFKGYVSASRHRVTSWLVTSHGAELREVADRRPMSAVEQPAPGAKALWGNVARNLSRQPLKESALAMLEQSAASVSKAAQTLQRGLRLHEAREKAGHARTTLRRTFEHRQAAQALGQLATRLDAAMAVRAPLLARIEALAKSVPAASEAAARARPQPAPAPKARPVRLQRTKVSMEEAQAQAADAMARFGIDLRGRAPVLDGQHHYAALHGQKGRSRSAGYRIHYDGIRPAGTLINYKTGERQKWVADGEQVQVSPEEAARIRAEARKAEATRAAEDRAKKAAAAAKAERQIAQSRPAPLSHPYLLKKAVEAHGARIDRQGRLLLPLHDIDGRTLNTQTISPDGGTKLYLPDAQKIGVHHLMGRLDPARSLVLAEGFATAATVREALRIPVAMTLDAGNLMPVARAYRERHPGLELLFAADNDAHLPLRPGGRAMPNTGLEKATKAADEVRGLVLLSPELGHRTLADQGTDWNDFAKELGKAAARDALLAELRRQREAAGMQPPAAPRPAPSNRPKMGM